MHIYKINSLITGPSTNSKRSLSQSLNVFSILKIAILIFAGIALALCVVLTVYKLQNRKNTSGSSVLQHIEVSESDHAVEFQSFVIGNTCSDDSFIFRLLKIKYQQGLID